MKRIILPILIGLVVATAQAKDEIRQDSDFTGFLKSGKGIAAKIASKCSPEEITVMTQSLAFKDGKLSGMNIKYLKDKLTKEEFNELWTAFGLDPKQILIDYICGSTGSCRKWDGQVCNTDTCHP